MDAVTLPVAILLKLSSGNSYARKSLNLLLPSEKSRESSHIRLSNLWQKFMLQVSLSIKESCVVAPRGLNWRWLSDSPWSTPLTIKKGGVGLVKETNTVVALSIYLITTPLGGCCTRPWASRSTPGIEGALSIAVVWWGVKELAWYHLGAVEQIFV